MSIDKRANDTYRFRIMKDGIPYTTTFKGTEKQAIKKHEEFKLDVQRGNVGFNENMKFVELAQLVMDNYVKVKCKYNTIEQYKNVFNNHLLDEFGGMKLSNIKPLTIQKFINKLSLKNLSANTIHSIITCLNKTFTLAVRWQIIIPNNNPCLYIEKPSLNKTPKINILTTDEIQKLFNVYDNLSSKPSRIHKLAFYIAIGCGLRNSEIRALTLDDIDYENSIIKVNKQDGKYIKDGEIISGNIDTKSTSSIRDVYAPEFVMNEIKDYVSKMEFIPPTGQIFWSSRGKKVIGRLAISEFFTNTLKKNNLPLIDFHDLRHIHATLLVNGGTNIKSISSRMGHSRVETTNIYMHNIDEIDKEAAILLENSINSIKENKV